MSEGVQFEDQGGRAAQRFVAERQPSFLVRLLISKGFTGSERIANLVLLAAAILAVIVAVLVIALSGSDRDVNISEAQRAKALQVMPRDVPPFVPEKK